MNKLIWSVPVAVALLAVAVLAAAVPAGAERRSAIAIRTVGTFTGPTTVEGSWTATGAIEDSGTYTETFEILDGRITAQKVLVGSRGTVVLEARGRIAFDGCEASLRGGKWRIADGTGAYRRLRGGGRPVATPESRGNVCTGAVDVTHAGKARQRGHDDDHDDDDDD
jgi:hypothetical protein